MADSLPLVPKGRWRACAPEGIRTIDYCKPSGNRNCHRRHEGMPPYGAEQICRGRSLIDPRRASGLFFLERGADLCFTPAEDLVGLRPQRLMEQVIFL